MSPSKASDIPESVQFHWKGIRKGDRIQLVQDVYRRRERGEAEVLAAEPPGYLIAQKGMIGSFHAKTADGFILFFKTTRGNGVLVVMLQESAFIKA